MKPPQKQTIYDIAQRLSTSPSTVSASLNGTWKARRIKESTANKIIEMAGQLGYSVNLQARGLRTARSGLIGLILPEHNNRFFSDLSQSFTLEARQRNQCPIIIATQRNPAAELETAQDLMAYSIDALVIAGASDPEHISEVCRASALPHVFIDQPYRGAPSVITDNADGARRLTESIIASLRPGRRTPERDRIYLVGGDARLHASSRRISGFRAAIEAEFGICHPDQIIACGYDPDIALTQFIQLCDRLGGLPAGLFANSINVFEALLKYLIKFPEAELQEISVGCFDYEPYGELLRFPVHMVRQRHRQLVKKAFGFLDDQMTKAELVMVKPELYLAHPSGRGVLWSDQ